MNKVTILIEDRIAQEFADDLNSLFGKYGGDMVWGSDGGIEHVDDNQMFAGNYIDNLLKEYRNAKSGNTEPKKAIEDNYPNLFQIAIISVVSDEPIEKALIVAQKAILGCKNYSVMVFTDFVNSYGGYKSVKKMKVFREGELLQSNDQFVLGLVRNDMEIVYGPENFIWRITEVKHVDESKKPIEDNYPNNLHNWGFALDSPEHQLLAAAIDYAQSKRGIDQEWGTYRGDGGVGKHWDSYSDGRAKEGWCDVRDRYKERAQGVVADEYIQHMRGVYAKPRTYKRRVDTPAFSPIVKPLLVLSFKQNLRADHIGAINARLVSVLSKVGWLGLVVDGMDKQQVQAFGVDSSTLDTLSLDQLIELLEGVKRLREATTQGEGGSQH